VIYNWCEENSFPANPLAEEQIVDENSLRILYAGTMGAAQGLETVIECAEVCQKEGLNVRLKLVGNGISQSALQSMVQAKRLSNCEILSGRPLSEMHELFNWANVLLVHLKDDPLFRITIPSKTQAYLFLGKPILMAVKGDAANIIQEAGAGMVCHPESTEEMLKTIRKFLSMTHDERLLMGARGNAFYRKTMSFDIGVAAFEKVFQSLSI
jgi:glycosyltransferase involved in cell wall biosynthesis